MNMNEKESYLERVRNWHGGDRRLLKPRADDDASQYQNVIAAASAWNDAEVKAFNEGAVLVTALVGIVDSNWLPDNIYIKSAKRAIRFITKSLDDINEQYSGVTFPRKGEIEPRIAYFGEGAADTSKVPGLMQDAAEKQAEAFVAAMEQGRAGDEATLQRWLARPKHLSQYIHLLPESTQKKAEGIKVLFLRLEEARENMKRLIDDPHADASVKEHWAKKATTIDNQIGAIFKEIDTEWAKVAKSGRVVVDSLGMAHVLPVAAETDHAENGQDMVCHTEDVKDVAEQGKKPAKKRGRPTKAEAKEKAKAAAAKEEEKKRKAVEKMSEDEKAKRREYLKKWLRDTRTAKSPKHDEQWLKNHKELQLLGGEVTDAMKKAAEHYEISIPE